MKITTFKKCILLLTIPLTFCGVLLCDAQKRVGDILGNSGTSILFLGIDFTKTKIIDDATANAINIRDRQYAGINEVVIDEPKKYDIKGAFHKREMDHDIGLVAKRNLKVNTSDILSTNTSDFHRMQESDIVSLIKGFDFGDKKGVGLLFVVEAISKSVKAAAIWVTLVDLDNKKLLLTERMEGKMGGFGFRNYVASSVKKIIDQIADKKYKEWKNR